MGIFTTLSELLLIVASLPLFILSNNEFNAEVSLLLNKLKYWIILLKKLTIASESFPKRLLLFLSLTKVAKESAIFSS